MKLGTEGSNSARRPPVSGSQNLPSGRFTRVVGRRVPSTYSVTFPLAGSKCATLKPPSSVTHNVPSESGRRELGALSIAMTQRESFVRSADMREIELSEADTAQIAPPESLMRFEPS